MSSLRESGTVRHTTHIIRPRGSKLDHAAMSNALYLGAWTLGCNGRVITDPAAVVPGTDTGLPTCKACRAGIDASRIVHTGQARLEDLIAPPPDPDAIPSDWPS